MMLFDRWFPRTQQPADPPEEEDLRQQLADAIAERDDAIGKRDYTRGLLAKVRTRLEEAYRERDRAARERDEARKDLADQTYRHGTALTPSARAQVLAETARADQLAELVDRLQTANMAMDRAPAEPAPR